MPPPDLTQNMCNVMEWKIPYTLPDIASPELKIKYDDCGIDTHGNADVPVPVFKFKDCRKPLTYETIFPLLFDELPDADDSIGGYQYLLYGYKNIRKNKFYSLDDTAQENESFQNIILDYYKIKGILFKTFNQECIKLCSKKKFSGHAHGSCCGFTAPIIACIYYYYKN